MNCTNMKKECEMLWAKNKYYVLSKSHKAYLEIREYLKAKEVDILFLKERIQTVRDLEESKKDFSNAVLHVWGYFKKDASEVEKQGLFTILEKNMVGKMNQNSVIEYIKVLLKKYPNKYLQESTLLTGEYDETVA
ncbi:YbgA family protein [Solobacterium moorei]|uniref:YbgA family protein n=1 Tax=Solobacterium moorei TaxID=102148 RepID=UPI0028D3419D|nr:YbgA family protein [Solobacterium moorei]